MKKQILVLTLMLTCVLAVSPASATVKKIKDHYGEVKSDKNGLTMGAEFIGKAIEWGSYVGCGISALVALFALTISQNKKIVLPAGMAAMGFGCGLDTIMGAGLILGMC